MLNKWQSKTVLALLMILVLVTVAVGCTTDTGEQTEEIQQEVADDSSMEAEEKPKLKIATLKGPTGMGMVDLMEKSETNESTIDYEFTVLGSPDDLVGKVISGEVDVAAVPTNLALVLHNKTEGAVQLAAVNTLGVLYVVENGDTINSVEDLRCKTLYTSGKGSAPDFVIQYILNENGLVVGKDVMLEYKLQHAELAAALAAGDVDIALLPQPHVTTAMMKNTDLKIALDITKEWNEVTPEDSKLPMGAIIVQKAFVEENKEAFNGFLDEYKSSVAFVNSNIDKASELIEKHGILPKAAIAKKAIPYSNIVFIEGDEAKSYLEDFYQVLFNFEPKSVGGKLPNEGFYYKR
ncbi:ABC transporter substrate-binding protein [Alkaliphilus pronyensis]|uniref:ABC transporter substrate-binding protein n=1 Tax=Alkaliphilus pronyensis TaxID=1482732 RepID=A0A6I0FBW4_9FIRM|nr:MqnA/MqnD/SBP family protein [Alkaliphilus pronyensis]KAB3536056.1 ABC transporter substrate-binding protein [Alkaliphilus pronyensis]